ncbi:DUF4251 domain-containing protein [Winogradskyella sp. PE311]|uniref:DUF4251 domain-containing protein n=1 Tax=Winogradskyella sp. PE311 TaxID=3366943 RepID=UPI0039805882
MRQLLTFLTLILLSCGSSKSNVELAEESKAFDELKRLVESGRFQFDAEVLYPLQTMDVINVSNKLLRNTGNNGGRVSLSTGYKIKIKNDSAIANLPYVGEVRISNAYINGDDVGINFNNIIRDYNIDASKGLKVKFIVKDKVESYDIIMKLYADKTADVNIISSHRTSAKYRGRIIPLLK